MKNLLKLVLQLVIVCAILWIVGTRFEKVKEEKNKKSAYSLYDPFNDAKEVALLNKIKKQDALEEKDPASTVESAANNTEIQNDGSAVQSPTVAPLEISYNDSVLPVNISRSRISMLIFAKPVSTCDKNFNSDKIANQLKQLEAKELLLTVESILPKEAEFPPAKASINTKSLRRDNILNFSFPNKGHPKLLGFYVCSDVSQAGKCSNKNFIDYENTEASESDVVFFFSYLHFDLETMHLLSFAETNHELMIDALSRKLFGPINKDNLTYIKAKEVDSNQNTIKVKQSSTAITLLFPFYDADKCVKKKSVDKAKEDSSNNIESIIDGNDNESVASP